MASYCASVLIAQLRKQRGLSQEKLAQGICDRRTISYIESGAISPGKFVFEQLMQRLGVDPGRFSNFISSKAELRFHEATAQMNQLFSAGEREKIESLLQELEGDKTLRDNRFAMQYVLKTRAWILAGGMDWSNAGDSQLPVLLDKALRLTCPHYDLHDIGGKLYTIAELDLLRMFGLMQLYTGRTEQALTLFTDLDSIISTGYIYSQDISGIHAAILVCIAKSLRWLGRYDKALAASERGLRVCITGRRHGSIPWQLYQKASALYHLGQHEQCRTLLGEALILGKHFEEAEFVSFVQQRSADLDAGRF